MDLHTIDSTSETYLGQWNRLVSTTNWEKGRIISQWRAELVAADAPVAEYSDEAWGRRVGSVTPQHVGRLRRVFDRFGETRQSYPGLFWSHFQAALDWDDAEMWLEGAVQNSWSISEMRRTRWEANEATGPMPADSDLVTAELDEDAGELAEAPRATASGMSVADVRDSDQTNTDAELSTPEASDDLAAEAVVAEPTVIRQPFADLPSLPSDVTDAFEAFKLCILRHRLAGWQEISQADLLATLDALKELASVPTEHAGTSAMA